MLLCATNRCCTAASAANSIIRRAYSRAKLAFHISCLFVFVVVRDEIGMDRRRNPGVAMADRVVDCPQTCRVNILVVCCWSEDVAVDVHCWVDIRSAVADIMMNDTRNKQMQLRFPNIVFYFCAIKGLLQLS